MKNLRNYFTDVLHLFSASYFQLKCPYNEKRSVFKSAKNPYMKYYCKFISSQREEHFWYFRSTWETGVWTASKLSKTMSFGTRNCSLECNLKWQIINDENIWFCFGWKSETSGRVHKPREFLPYASVGVTRVRQGSNLQSTGVILASRQHKSCINVWEGPLC